MAKNTKPKPPPFAAPKGAKGGKGKSKGKGC